MPRPKKYQTKEEAAQVNRDKSAARSREKSRATRELGSIPKCSDPELRERMRYDLELFATTCFPHLICEELGKPQKDLLAALQQSLLNGEATALALPRGYGKSTLCLIGVLWSVLYCHQEYVLLIGASASAGKRLISNIKAELLFNPILGPEGVTPDTEEIPEFGGLFPAATYPLRKIGSLALRATGQVYNGVPTRCVLGSDKIVFPTIAGEPTSGLIIEGAGLSGELRGRNYVTSAGALRPTAIVLDDPQTDASARSAPQVEKRMELITGAISGLAAVNKTPALLATVTVVEQDDLACKLLKSPYWRSVRYGVIDKLPDETCLAGWAEYNNLRTSLIEEGMDDKAVQQELNQYFKANERLLTGDMVPSWEAFRRPGDVSPLQRIMELYHEDFRSFVRERMNAPELATTGDFNKITIEKLEEKIGTYARNSVPLEVESITCGMDSQTAGIYYVILGHAQDGSCWVLDYQKYPKAQKKTITSAYGDITLEAAVYAGYSDLFKDLLNRRYQRLDGLEMQIGKFLIDGSHGPTNPSVQRAIRDAQDPRLQLVYGRASSPDQLLFNKKRPGELRGKGWAMPPVKTVKIDGKRVPSLRYCLLDVNAWKSTLRSKILARQGTPGSLVFFKDAPANFREFFLHLTAEKSTVKSGKYGELDIWSLLPGRANHWWDCLNYALAASTMNPISAGGKASYDPRVEQQYTRKRIRLSEVQAARGGY